jgi:hypothetical protein
MEAQSPCSRRKWDRVRTEIPQLPPSSGQLQAKRVVFQVGGLLQIGLQSHDAHST